MIAFTRRSISALAAGLALAATSILVTPVHAQQKPVIKVSSLTLPVFAPLLWNVIKARGLDAKHGFELEMRPYPSISA